ncbi:DHA2 family methylenomycin A resistance protein-like MFS transporter [Kitasatospora viridis]|uniref:DHA2 family methylenomycin A resistance protein-like MFS transporter n=2 Tax=Kitasatospora viridis TaxID=281105 RepID=A0A561UD85_9ACTN|nr:DHA2 family methylenomycin A resistance protein-like MFS transporter [Kitasatospora viridis]
MCAGMFLVLLDVTVVNVALAGIGGALHTGLDGLQWVVDAYTVVLAACLLGAGVVGDRLGHRTVLVAGLVLFGGASLACGAAPGIGALVAARAVQGLAAALLLPSTLAVVNRTFPERREKARALGVWAGVSALALPAGPLVGGALVSGAGWRWVFLVNLPVVALALLLTLRLLERDVPVRTRRLDLPGVLGTAVLLTALVFGAITAGRSGPHWPAGAALLVALLAALGLAAWERRAADPMLPPELLRRADFVGANLVAGSMNFVGLGLTFVLSLYLQSVRHHAALTAGLMLLPLFSPLAVCAPFTGRLVARYGPRPPMLAGLLLGIAGSADLLALRWDSGYPVLLPALACLGFAMGLLTPAVVAAALQAGPADRPGLSSGVNNTCRQAGGALGIAAFGALARDPGAAQRFTSGLHLAGAFAALLWSGSVLLTLRTVPRITRGE